MELVKSFVGQEVLNSGSLKKTQSILGTINGQPAILAVEKTPFSKTSAALAVDDVNCVESNDIYSWGTLNCVQNVVTDPTCSYQLIYPATETHIKKHRAQPTHIVRETPEMYEKLVVPYIKSMLGNRIKWVTNILHHGAEADRVIYRDDDPVNGFVLVPDMKWDGYSIEFMYLTAIVMREDVRSVRDLNISHTAFLTKIRDTIVDIVKSRYNIEKDRLKLYFHYQPSYYHMHIHVEHVAHANFDFGRSLLLDNVIDQLQYYGDKGFSQVNMTYFIGEGHDLYKIFSEAGVQ